MRDHRVTGTLVSVAERPVGSHLLVAASLGATTLTPYDVDDFDHDGGMLQLGEGSAIWTTSYTVNVTAGTLTLGAPTTAAYAVDDPVLVYPTRTERIAFLIEPEGEEEIEVIVPAALYAQMALGVRTPGEGEEIEAIARNGEYVLVDISAQEPQVDGSFVIPGTGADSDGDAPPTSPTANLQLGPGYIVAKWLEVGNADLVTYEVHVSASSGFTPTGVTFLGQTPGTGWVATSLPDGTPFTAGVTYYVRIVAKDADGAASVGVQDSIVFELIQGEQIAVDAITAAHILAGAVEADKIAAGAVLADKIDANAIDGMVITGATIQTDEDQIGVKLDTEGLRLYGPDGVTTVQMDAASGNASLRGTFAFGNGSQLHPEDLMELEAQPLDFQTPLNSAGGSASGEGTTASVELAFPSGDGNLVLLTIASAGGTHTTPSGWAVVGTVGAGNRRISVFRRNTSTSWSGVVSSTISISARWAAKVTVYTGLEAVAADLTTSNSGTGSTASVSTSPTNTNFTNERVLVFFASAEDWPADSGVGDPTGYEHESNQVHPTSMHASGDRIMLDIFAKNTTATGVQSASAAFDGSNTWVAFMATFRAKDGGPPAAAGVDKLRLYAQGEATGSTPSLRFLDENNVLTSLLGTLTDAKVRIAFGTHGISVGATPGATTQFAHGAGSSITRLAAFALVDRASHANAFRCIAGASFPAATEDILLAVRTNNDSNVGGSVDLWWMLLYTPNT